MTAEEILARAADRVEKGHCKGALYRTFPEEQYCLVGAIIMGDVNWKSGFYSTEANQAYSAVMQELGPGVNPVDWNNDPKRTSIEVSTTLRNAKRWL